MPCSEEGPVFDPKRVAQDLEEARRTYGGRAWPASFADRLTSPLAGPRDVLRMMMQRASARVDAADVARIPATPRAELPARAPGATDVTWIGHATYAIRTGGLTILTDPVFSAAIPGLRRLVPPGVPLAGLGDVDAVVISHNHYDHLDVPSIGRLSRDVPVLVPGMLGAWFRRRDFTHVIELDWWESVAIGEVSFSFVPAHHWSRRGLSDTCKTLWGGWVMSADGGPTIYFAGDSGYGYWFGEIGAAFPGIDLALLPIGAYEPDWFMRPVHMDPAEAVRACVEVGARRMAAMHWGTFRLSTEPVLEPPTLARAAWAATGRPDEDLWLSAIGETRTL
jgi:L-ascorbate metabolism protein UlaG (beta-lactamase superfamily)